MVCVSLDSSISKRISVHVINTKLQSWWHGSISNLAAADTAAAAFQNKFTLGCDKAIANVFITSML